MSEIVEVREVKVIVEAKEKIVKHKENPFLASAITTIKTRKKRLTVAQGGTIIDNETGEATAETVIAQVIEVDDGNFVKLFTKDIKNFFDLTPAGLKTFGLVLNVVQTEGINRDKIFIHNQDEQLKNFNLSRAVFFRGIDELIKKKFLAKTVIPNWYFINPNLFFNGDRAKFIKEYRIKQGGATLDEQVKTRIANKTARKELGKDATVEDVKARAAQILESQKNDK